MLSSRSKASVTIAVGDREVQGEVIRGARPTPTPTPTPTKAGYTMADVKLANSSSKCWSVIDGNVYDLTKWITSHPGGASAILFLCGKDGANAFKAQHENQGRPAMNLSQYLLGPLAP